MELLYSRDFGIIGFSPEVISAIGNPDFIVVLINQDKNTLVFKGMRRNVGRLYGYDAFDVPREFYDANNNSYYGIEKVFFIRNMLSDIGIDEDYVCLPTRVARDPDGDQILVVEMNEAYAIDKPDVGYILSQKQDIEEWLEEPLVEDESGDDNEGLEYE